MTFTAVADFEALRRRCTGSVVTPSDQAWDDARQAWNLAVDQRPAAVAIPADETDVVAVVNFAREAGLRVAPQGTGHNAAPLGALANTVLLKTSGMTGVEIDAASRRARVRAGALWQDVMPAAGAHGLAPLGGSSPDVGVVGYSLGGGIGWLARKHGLQANAITAVELVTADGSLVRADHDNEPALFWALRGGGGNFGVVTALEFELHPVSSVIGGALVWDWTESERVLQRWAEWAPGAPDEITTSARILQLPPFEDIPEPLRGRKLVMIDGAYAGDEAAAGEVLAPLRELDPEIDMFAPVPVEALIRIHGDPEHPVPGASASGMLDALPSEAVSAFVAATGPDSGSPLLAAELRQLGGALGRPAPEHGALAQLDAAFALFAVGIAMDPASGAAVTAHAQGLKAALAPWASDRSYLSFVEQPTDVSAGYRPDAYRVLQAIRGQVDPDGLFHANHVIEGS